VTVKDKADEKGIPKEGDLQVKNHFIQAAESQQVDPENFRNDRLINGIGSGFSVDSCG
jgi:hypothetical protein